MIRNITGLFGLRWLYNWIFGRILKNVDKALESLPQGNQSQRKRVLIIDDDRYMKTYVEEWIGDMDIEQIYGLPMDQSKLLPYDALVVDGQSGAIILTKLV